MSSVDDWLVEAGRMMAMCLRGCSIFFIAIAYLLPCSSLAGELPEATAVTLVGAFRVNVRSSPEIWDDNVLVSLNAGTQLPFQGVDGDWLRVSLPDRQRAWVHMDFARTGPPHDQLVVVPDLVRIRQSPGLDSAVLSRAAGGLILQGLGKSGEWFRVRLPHPEGLEGWIRQDLVESLPPATGLELAAAPSVPEAGALRAETPNPPELAKLFATDEGRQLESAIETSESLPRAHPETQGFLSRSNLKLGLLIVLGWLLFIAFGALGTALFMPPNPQAEGASPRRPGTDGSSYSPALGSQFHDMSESIVSSRQTSA